MDRIERAIESTKNRIFYIADHAENGKPAHCVKAEKQVEIQTVILEALDRQKPRKVLNIRERHNFQGEVILRFGLCPECESGVDTTYLYCKQCGVPLEWDDELR